MATLEEKILKINEEFDKKQQDMLDTLAEERKMAIAKETVGDVIEKMPSMSMGNIISIFENVSGEVLKTRGGKKTINDFLKLVKEDKNIHNSYLLKENISTSANIANPKEFINESIAIANETSDRSRLKESKANLAKFVSEAISKISPDKISDKVVLDDGTKKVNDNLDILMWGRRTIQNTAARNNSLNETIDFMTRKPSSDTQENVFENCKNDCINAINEAWEVSDSSVRIKLTEIKDKLSKKQYSELTADDDIKYMKELINTIK